MFSSSLQEEEEENTPDGYLSPSSENLKFGSESPSLLRWVLEENNQSGNSWDRMLKGSVNDEVVDPPATEEILSQATSKLQSLFESESQVMDLNTSSDMETAGLNNFPDCTSNTENSRDCSLSEEMGSPDLFSAQTEVELGLPVISEQDIADALGIVEDEDDTSPSIFSQSSEDSVELSIPSPKYFKGEEKTLQTMVGQLKQEKRDQKLAKLLSQGIDATQQRCLRRNSNKTNQW